MLMRKYTPPKCTHDRKTVADRCTDACHRLKDMVVKSDAPAGYRVTLKARAVVNVYTPSREKACEVAPLMAEPAEWEIESVEVME